MDRSWAAASGGKGRLMLVDGVGGIGKTRLIEATSDLAEASGGVVLHGRCHPAERSLFLQPFVDALRPVLLGSSDAELGELLREHSRTLGPSPPGARGDRRGERIGARPRQRSSVGARTTP